MQLVAQHEGGAGGVGVEVATGVDAGAGAGADVVGAVVVTGFVPAEN